MKVVRSNLRVLVAQKGQRERRRISLRALADETGISYYTVTAIANDTISDYPKNVLASLCSYFECGIGDLLFVEDIPKGST
jgi:putative transcriptional regulator